mmetsp:Transcript_5429/g.10971  ORF Transcript_5429/g.10971 Transcript_5429/m.10971 type:complete len:252 (+) Transcript_5429:1396-2151(+)
MVLLSVLSSGGWKNISCRRRRNSLLCSGTTAKPVQPAKLSLPSGLKPSATIKPSTNATCSCRSKHSFWLFMCCCRQISICPAKASCRSHIRFSLHCFRSSTALLAQCLCPSRAVCCNSGRSFMCAPRPMPTAELSCLQRLLARSSLSPSWVMLSLRFAPSSSHDADGQGSSSHTILASSRSWSCERGHSITSSLKRRSKSGRVSPAHASGSRDWSGKMLAQSVCSVRKRSLKLDCQSSAREVKSGAIRPDS